MNWVISGIWGDENMPDVELWEIPLFGTYVSEPVQVEEDTEEVWVKSKATLSEQSKLELEYSVKKSPFEGLPYDDTQRLFGPIEEIRRKSSLQFKVHMRTGSVVSEDVLETLELVMRGVRPVQSDGIDVGVMVILVEK